MIKTLRSALAGLLLAGLASLLPGRILHAAMTDDAVITVSPIADVSLSLDVTSYAFGLMDVNTSTHSATKLTLTNNGQVSIKVDKRIAADPTVWTAGTSPGLDTYVLYAATSTTRLGLSSFTAGTKFGAQGNVSYLSGPAGTEPVLPPEGADTSVDLWFRLDMPTQVSSSASQSITVRFTGVPQ